MQQFQLQIDENKWLIDRVYEHKSTLESEKLALKASAALLATEMDSRRKVEQTHLDTMEIVYQLLPNFDRIVENDQFLRRSKYKPVIALDPKIYEMYGSLFDAHENYVVEDATRLLSIVNMKTFQDLEMGELVQKINSLKAELNHIKNSDLRDIQKAYQRTSASLDNAWIEKGILKEKLDDALTK